MTKSRTPESPTIRPFVAQDAQQVAMLWQKQFRGSAAAPSAALEQYFVDLFLNHPWFDPELAPIVLDLHGEVAGFIGRMARPMVFRGQPIRCVVATQLMVDPDRRLAFGAIEVVRAMFAGPHDLCYSDGANEYSLRIWQRCGGQASRLLSFEWTRQLRPTQSFCLRLQGHARLGRLARAAHPMSGLLDTAAAALLPRLYHKPIGHLTRQAATAEQILPLLQSVCSKAPLHPEYSAQSLAWLLHKAAESRTLGDMHSAMVMDAQGEAIGWFIYFARKGGLAQVLQMGARYGRGPALLAELFRDAWDRGAAAISGQLDPALITELSNSHCQFRCPGMGVLLHSRNPDLLNALQQGEAFMSRLEGEWWMRLGIDRHYEW